MDSMTSPWDRLVVAIETLTSQLGLLASAVGATADAVWQRDVDAGPMRADESAEMFADQPEMEEPDWELIARQAREEVEQGLRRELGLEER